MTTIATDGRTIAADGQQTAGNERVTQDAVKIVMRNRVIYGLTGHSGLLEPLIAWHQAGAAVVDLPKGDSWSLIVIDQDGLSAFTETCPYRTPFPYPAAFGSGDTYALGAMAAGASPREAVEISARYDINTGGRIMEICIPDVLGVCRAYAAA